MKTSSKHAQRLAVCGAASLLLVPVLALFSRSSHAQSPEELAEQQVEAMRQYMQAAGVDPQQMEQATAIIRGNAQMVGAKEAAENAQATREFEARTAGLGTANVAVEGYTYEYQITKCATGQGNNGDGFRIDAQQGAAERDGKLTVWGNSHYKRVEIQLINRDGFWEAHSYPLPELEGDSFEWTGTVEGERGKTQMSMTLDCSNE